MPAATVVMHSSCCSLLAKHGTGVVTHHWGPFVIRSMPRGRHTQPRLDKDGTSIIACMQDQEKGHVQQLQLLMPGYRARPSLLGPVAAAAGLSLGAAAGLLPTKLSPAITGMLRSHTRSLLAHLSRQSIRNTSGCGLTSCQIACSRHHQLIMSQVADLHTFVFIQP